MRTTENGQAESTYVAAIQQNSKQHATKDGHGVTQRTLTSITKIAPYYPVIGLMGIPIMLVIIKLLSQ